MPSFGKPTSSRWMGDAPITLVIPSKGEPPEIVRAVQASTQDHDLIQTVHVIHNLPYGQAIKQGIEQATTPYMATMDADGQHHPDDLRMVALYAVHHHYDLVIGHDASWHGLRTLISRGLNLVASGLTRSWIADFGSGLRVFKREVVLPWLPLLPDGFDFNAALTLSFLLTHRKLDTYPITVHRRVAGRSHVRLRDGLQTLRTLATWQRRLRHALPDAHHDQ